MKIIGLLFILLSLSGCKTELSGKQVSAVRVSDNEQMMRRSASYAYFLSDGLVYQVDIPKSCIGKNEETFKFTKIEYSGTIFKNISLILTCQ